ncbi:MULTISPECIES: hypothetical protein [Candidatus Nitrosocaldus]|jgi:hypothetical protein|uniref:Uncharacterized protein n=1 Tax=Candidatus Nitrosocaldus cavascurensis TaxID=2058097 RepID=A0A2K5ARI5_9ARCH|nr:MULTISPECIES: hypothetical protein [Candidatus Nitrosocaldus]SPC34247.1 protein of unknown function [Candidatus Nitrosocaldus cavascurensis]
MIKKILPSSLKTLPLAVRGISISNPIEVVEYNNEYYTLNRDSIDTTAEIEVNIIASVKTIEEVYNLLLARVLNDNPDPFAITLQAIDNPTLLQYLKEIKALKIEEAVEMIPRAYLEYLEKRLREQERKKPVIIDISLINGIVEVIKYLKTKGKSEQEIEHIFFSLLEPEEDERAYYYWNGHDLLKAVKLLVEEEEREREKQEIVVGIDGESIGQSRGDSSDRDRVVKLVVIIELSQVDKSRIDKFIERIKEVAREYGIEIRYELH